MLICEQKMEPIGGKKITNFKGQPPTPRDKLSCWVYKDRLIYFGGYGCRKHNELSDCFDVHDAFWEGQIFWGWHNDVHVFDTNTQTWSQPAIRGGDPPQPRAAHTCAVLGNKGYIFGGRVLGKGSTRNQKGPGSVMRLLLFILLGGKGTFFQSWS